MQSQKSNEIKDLYSEYANKNGYVYHSSEPIVAPQNSRLLFNISGGVIYQDELLEKKEALEGRVASIQKCLRTDTMDNIGISGRHHLLFEMIGHFIFNVYKEQECKEEFINFAYKFLTEEVGLNRDRIFATVHPYDDITLNIWRKLNNDNIIISDKNTFISPYAEKSALRTEILWQKDDDDKTLIELWNLVFTQFNSKKIFDNPSNFVAADSGASLERIVSASEDKLTNYDNSMWADFINFINKSSNNISIIEARRIADFTNTITGLIDEGIIPGNKVQPYMLRKMLRMLFEMCDENGLNIDEIIRYNMLYSDITLSFDDIIKIINDEKKKYFIAINNGLKRAKKEIDKKGIENIDVSFLKSSCGLPEKYVNKILDDDNNVLRLVKKIN